MECFEEIKKERPSRSNQTFEIRYDSESGRIAFELYMACITSLSLQKFMEKSAYIFTGITTESSIQRLELILRTFTVVFFLPARIDRPRRGYGGSSPPAES